MVRAIRPHIPDRKVGTTRTELVSTTQLCVYDTAICDDSEVEIHNEATNLAMRDFKYHTLRYAISGKIAVFGQ